LSFGVRQYQHLFIRSTQIPPSEQTASGGLFFSRPLPHDPLRPYDERHWSPGIKDFRLDFPPYSSKIWQGLYLFCSSRIVLLSGPHWRPKCELPQHEDGTVALPDLYKEPSCVRRACDRINQHQAVGCAGSVPFLILPAW
jgi:hypothetical protein